MEKKSLKRGAAVDDLGNPFRTKSQQRKRIRSLCMKVELKAANASFHGAAASDMRMTAALALRVGRDIWMVASGFRSKRGFG